MTAIGVKTVDAVVDIIVRIGPEVVIGIGPVNVIEHVIMGVGPEQRSEPAKDKTATPPRPGRTEEAAVEPRRSELRLQRYVGNGAGAEHPVTQVAPAGEKMPAAVGSGNPDVLSAATMPAAAVSATMPATSATVPAAAVSATVPAATVSATTVSATTVSATTVPAATALRVCFEYEKRHDEEQRS